jgi:lipopolysaccharide transport system permease protein
MQQKAYPSSVIVRTADARWSFRFSELWKHRELLYFLAWRDIKVRYKQTVLGVAWVVLQPLAVALILTLFLGRLVQMPSGALPYIVFAFSGMVIWQLFTNVLTESSNSLPANERLVSKVYFPRLVIPISVALAAVPDFLISAAVLAVLLGYFHVVPRSALFLTPFLILLDVLIALGVGLWLAALNVRYRDVRYTVGLLTQVWFFATPVAYPVSVVPQRWQSLYMLNPLVGVVESFRWALTPSEPLPITSLAVSFSVAFILLITGLLYFTHTEDTFADFI